MIALAQETRPVDTWQPPYISQLNCRLETKSAEEILQWSIEQFGGGFSIGSAFGASGMALIDMAVRINPDVDIFYIDTDYFFPESLDLIERAQRHYNRPFRRVASDTSVAEQEQTYGLQLYRSDADKCCNNTQSRADGPGPAGQHRPGYRPCAVTSRPPAPARPCCAGMTNTALSRYRPWSAGPKPTSGPIFINTTSPTTSCTSRTTPASVAGPARSPSNPATICAPAAGSG